MRFLRAVPALVFLAARAHAEPPSARLLYARGDDAETCPDARALRDAVTMRLGYDPFRADAATTVEARVVREAKGFRADVRLYDATGTLAGERELTSKGSDCAALGASMALTISILVDPKGIGRRAPPPAAAPRPEPPPGTPFDAADIHDSPFEHPPPPAPPREPIVLRAGLAGIASIGAAPSLASGVAALVGVARRPWSIDLEGRADLPASSGESDGSAVRSSLLVGGVVPCYAAGVLRLCLVGVFGALRGEGIGVTGHDRDETFYAAAGMRLGLEPPIGGGFVLRTYTDALAPLVKTTLRAIDREAVWTTPSVAVSLGLGLARLF